MTILLLTLVGLCAGCSSAPPEKNYAKSSARPTPKSPAKNTNKQSATKTTPEFSDAVSRGELRETAIAILVAAATGPAPEQRTNAIEALGKVPSRLEPLVRSALNDESIAVRAVAAAMVGRAKLASSASFVEPMTRDENPLVRASALYALRAVGQNVDLTPFADLLEDPSPRVRSHAAYLLGELGDPSAVGMLREYARDSMARAAQSDVRLMQLQFAEARVKLGDDSALHECRAALFPARNEDLEITAVAAQIAGEIQDRSSINQLISLTALKDGSGRMMPPEIRLAAAGSLAKLGLSQGAFIAREYVANPAPALRAQAAYVLGQTGQADNLADLEALTNDDNGLVRVAAASGILKITEGSGPGASSTAR